LRNIVLRDVPDTQCAETCTALPGGVLRWRSASSWRHPDL